MITPNFNTPAPPEIACLRCGVIDVPRIGPGSGPHAARLSCDHCGAFLRWLPRPRTAEERAEKDTKSGLRRSACIRQKPPTSQQIQYLQRLGYRGPRPANRLAASDLIAGLVSKGRAR